MIGHSRKLIAAVFFSGLATTAAAGPGMFGGHMAMDPEIRAEHAERMIERIAHKLRLSAEQEAQVRDIFAEARENSLEDRERMWDLRQQLPNVEPAEAQAMADEIGDITSRLVMTHATTRAAIRDLLDDEQLAEMESLMQQRRERMDKVREHRRMHRRQDWG